MSEHEIAHKARAHSSFGGSSIGRVIACAGSVALAATIPEEPSSVYAAEGTLAHEFAEYALAHGDRRMDAYIGMTIDGKVDAVPLTEEMAGAVQVYLDAVWEEFDRYPDAELYVEQRFVFGKDHIPAADEGEVFGANDCMIYSPSAKHLTVYDYKHGQGVSVSADDNDQLKFYAAGALMSKGWPVETIDLVIVQPRARDAEEVGAVKAWALDVLEVLEFTSVINDAVAAAKEQVLTFEMASEATADPQLTLTLTPGSHCRWCPARGVCPGIEQRALQNLGATIGPGLSIEPVKPKVLPEPKTLDTQRLANIVASADVIRKWLDGVEGYVQGLLVQGVAVPGFKLVDKVGRRKWTAGEADIAGWLTMVHGLDEADVRPPSLCTITEATSLLKQVYPAGKERTAALEDMEVKYTIKESSGVTLAPESDKRPAVDAAARAVVGVQLD